MTIKSTRAKAASSVLAMAMAMAMACALLVTAAFTFTSSRAYASGGGIAIERCTLAATEENGSPDTQAGSHPYELSAEAAFNENGDALDDVRFELPPGVVLDPGAVAPFFQCSIAEFVKAACSNGAAVGVAAVSAEGKTYPAAVYDLEPAVGEVARFGLQIADALLYIDATVGPGDKGMTLSIDHIPQAIAPTAIELRTVANRLS